MSDAFRFDITGDLSFAQGFDGEIQAVDSWGEIFNPQLFRPIPAGPLLLEIYNQDAAPNELLYAEDPDFQTIKEWRQNNALPTRIQKLITIQPGERFRQIINPAHKYIAASWQTFPAALTGHLTALGIPDRAPATMTRGIFIEVQGG